MEPSPCPPVLGQNMDHDTIIVRKACSTENKWTPLTGINLPNTTWSEGSRSGRTVRKRSKTDQTKFCFSWCIHGWWSHKESKAVTITKVRTGATSWDREGNEVRSLIQMFSRRYRPVLVLNQSDGNSGFCLVFKKYELCFRHFCTSPKVTCRLAGSYQDLRSEVPDMQSLHVPP